MTNREFLNAIVSANISEELTTFATESLAKLDARNEKRASKPSKTALANEPIKASIVEFVKAHGAVTASEVGAGVEITTQKASALLRQLAESGVVKASTVKVAKKGEVKSYAIA